MESGTLDFDDDAADLVLDRLEEALASGMLTEEGTGTRITYQFWHPLLVSHLSERLSAARRANLHRRAAEILRSEYKSREEEGAAIITDHLIDGGGDSTSIAYYAEKAGNRSYNLSDFPGAEKYYRIAMENLNDDAKERLHQAYLFEYLGECTRAQGKSEEARHFYEQALDLNNKYLVAVSLEDVEQKAQIIALLWSEIAATWYEVRNKELAMRYYSKSEDVLKEAGVVIGAVWATLRLRQGYIFWQEGNYEKALQCAHEALELLGQVLSSQKQDNSDINCSVRMARTIAGDPVDLGRIHVLLGTITDVIGQPSLAVNHLNTALAIMEQQHRRREIASAYCTLGDLYLREAKYEQAQAALRNSAILAEEVGDIPLLAIVFCNQGILLTRYGDLIEAEDWYRKGLAIAEKVNDPVYIDILLLNLAMNLLDQGKLQDTEECLKRSLKVGRSIHFDPYIGSSLVAIGSMRIYQVLISKDNQSRKRILKKAHITLLQALSFEGMEAQYQAEGALDLAYVELLQGKSDAALQRVRKTLEEAQKYELIWIVARLMQLLGCILAAQHQYREAYQYFEEAKEAFSTRKMRVEYARTLYYFGTTLLQEDLGVKERVRGTMYLREAQQICTECKAALDLQLVERALAEHEIPSTPVK